MRVFKNFLISKIKDRKQEERTTYREECKNISKSVIKADGCTLNIYNNQFFIHTSGFPEFCYAFGVFQTSNKSSFFKSSHITNDACQYINIV